MLVSQILVITSGERTYSAKAEPLAALIYVVEMIRMITGEIVATWTGSVVKTPSPKQVQLEDQSI